MRWCWIDRFIEFDRGRHAKAVKNVSLTESYLDDHFPGHPVMPKSLIIEGVAQTGGLLVCEYSGFTEKVILAKIPKVRFLSEVAPGSQLVYTTKVEYIKTNGAMVTATSHANGRLQAEMEIVFAHLGGDHANSFEPAFFLEMMQSLGAFEAGVQRAAAGARTLPVRPAEHGAPSRRRAATV